MLSNFLKRVLPFGLTLLVGMALGGFPNLFRARTATQTSDAVFTRTYQYNRSGCSSRKARLYGVGVGVGRLVGIRRLEADGNWVSVRPVGPEIYEETTRPAIIRSRPTATYTDEARSEHVTGTAMLEAVLSTSGEVKDIKPIRQLPSGLTVQAAQAAEQLEFEPALKNGRPVEQRIQLEFYFDM